MSNNTSLPNTAALGIEPPHDSYLAMVKHYGCAAGIVPGEGKTGGTPSGGDIFSKTAGEDTNQDSAG